MESAAVCIFVITCCVLIPYSSSYSLSMLPMLLAAGSQRKNEVDFKPATANFALPNAIGSPLGDEGAVSQEVLHSPTTGQLKKVSARELIIIMCHLAVIYSCTLFGQIFWWGIYIDKLVHGFLNNLPVFSTPKLLT